MKFKLFCFFVFAAVANVFAQQGVIKYKHTQYFEYENMPADLPKSNTTYKKLTFSDMTSRFETDPDVKVEVAEDQGQRGWMMRRFMNAPQPIIYKDYDKEQQIEQINFFGKDFLVSDSLTPMTWKVSAGEQKDILGYTCMKATLKDTSSNLIIAFFTPQISVPVGPDRFGQLPGVILEIQSAQTHIIATEIKLQDTALAVAPPNKGDKKSRAEFNKIREEKIKEQSQMWGGRGGNMRIIRQ